MELASAVAGVVSAAAQNERLQPKPGDFVKDGLLYCGKCKTQKQVEIELFGNVLKPYCLCECAAAEYEAEEEQRKREKQKEYIERLRNDAFPVAEMKKWTFEKDDGTNKRLSEIARRYVEKFNEIRKKSDNNGLILFGGVGTGKTFIAACIVNAMIDKAIPCYMTNFARLVNDLSSMTKGKQEFIDRLNDYELLVIDDLSAERETDYMNELIFNVIDSRAASKKPLIITTNLTAEQLKNPETERKRRIYSRLLERCIPIEVAGVDRRRMKLKENYKDITEMLGITEG